MNNTIYFKNGGKQNTKETLLAVKEAIKTYKPEAVVTGTLSGQPALEAANILKDTNEPVVQTYGYEKILKSDIKGIIAMPLNRLY